MLGNTQKPTVPLGLRALFATAALLSTTSLAAQSAQAPQATPLRTIQAGDTANGALEAGEPTESRYDDYRLSLNANDAVQIDLESDAFDTYLELRRAGRTEPLDSNDDRGDSLNSRIVFTATDAGEYIIHATRLYSGSGPYRLTVARLQSAQRTPLAVGRTGGEFDANTPLLPSNVGPSSRYRLFDLSGTRGDRIQLDMTSSALNPQLELLDPNGAVLVSASGGFADRRNARLLFEIPRDATYTVRATVPASQAGHFNLDLRQMRGAAAARPTELGRGAPFVGRFAVESLASQSANQIRYFYQDFILPVRRGEVLTLDLESQDFDSLLEVGVMSPIGFALAQRDDDSGDGLNARLVLRPDRSAPLYVRARTLMPQLGCFTLRVTPGEPAAPADPTSQAAPVPAPPTATPSQVCPAEPAAAAAAARRP